MLSKSRAEIVREERPVPLEGLVPEEEKSLCGHGPELQSGQELFLVGRSYTRQED
jgi:hypothetical protein